MRSAVSWLTRTALPFSTLLAVWKLTPAREATSFSETYLVPRTSLGPHSLALAERTLAQLAGQTLSLLGRDCQVVAFARRDRTGVLITLVPPKRNTSSKLAVNFVSRSLMRDVKARARPGSTRGSGCGLVV